MGANACGGCGGKDNCNDFVAVIRRWTLVRFRQANLHYPFSDRRRT